MPSSPSTPRTAWCSRRSVAWPPGAVMPPTIRHHQDRPPVDLLDRLRLDVPIAQAGMGGGLAGAELATAVAAAGGLGTLGLVPPAHLREGVRRMRDGAPGRAVAVNLLMRF